VGLTALLLFLGGVCAGLWRRVRDTRAGPAEVGLLVAAAGVFFTWLLHTSADWLHEIPGVTGIALFGAAVLVSPWRRPRGSRAGHGHAIAVAVCAVVVAVGVITVGRAALADEYREDAQQNLAKDPRAAIEDANDSLELNDEALDTYYIKSGAYARLGDYRMARVTLEEAARREPHNFVPFALLGDLAKNYNDYWPSQAYYRRASALNPREETLHNLSLDPFTYEKLERRQRQADRARGRRDTP
jgi:hypothetical protein